MAVRVGDAQTFHAPVGFPTLPSVLTEEVLVDCIESRRPAFVHMAAAMLGGSADAEDVVQEAALNAVRGFDSFRSEADVCSWFHRICLNACYQALRRRSTRPPGPVPDYGAMWRDPDYSVDPQAVVVALEDGNRVKAALRRLNPNQRMAVVLHDVEAWKLAEIADASGLALPTVKSHLRRGRQALVSMLGEQDE